MIFNILTRCTRTGYLSEIMKGIETNTATLLKIEWHVVFDTNVLKDIDAELLSTLQQFGAKLYFMKGQPGDFGHRFLNYLFDTINDGFIYILDDDNMIHPDFLSVIERNIFLTQKKGFVFNQRIDGKDFTGEEMRFASADNMKRSKVDSAQYVLHKSLIADIRLIEGLYIADSIFAEQVYESNPFEFVFIDKELCYYNFFQKKPQAKLPKIMVQSDNDITLKSQRKLWFEADELLVTTKPTITEQDVVNEDPDFIISIGKEIPFEEKLHLKTLKLDSTFDNLGDLAYNAAMINILDNNNKSLVSFFTPIYNTGDKLFRLYESLKNQTHQRWEWVIVNDSTDGGRTLKIAEDIAKNDYRVKVYDFRKKSGGIIGESKFRAAMMCNGEFIVEIDHDDYILPESADLLVQAFNKYPDAGFAYTDCVEILEDWKTTLKYPEGFCFSYGRYRVENCMGIDMNVNISPNINPKTIRHIVGIPNHIRAWRRKVYLELGGHNRRLSIADDYELVVRTFLNTKFIRINKNCYLQFIYNSASGSNTHELARADIQRRVRTIQEYYNFAIFKRFKELGVDDWAYLFNQSNPLIAPSRFGEEECAVNYDF